jgi:hypothetical protein
MHYCCSNPSTDSTGKCYTCGYDPLKEQYRREWQASIEPKWSMTIDVMICNPEMEIKVEV